MEDRKQRIVRHEIPEGAVMLTRAQALNEQMTLILGWKPQSEVWSLIHGRGILGIAASLSSLIINTQFRRKLKLRNFGRIPSMITLVGGPALLVGLCHNEFVLNKLLLFDTTCPVCLQTRGSLIQSFFGVIIPVFAAPIVNFALAASQARNVPHILEGRKILTLVRPVYQSMIPSLAFLFILQVLFGSYMTHLEIKSYLRMLDMQYLIEEEQKAARVYYNIKQ